MLARNFDARVQPRLDALALASPVRAAADQELRKLAGADMTQVTAMPPAQQHLMRGFVEDGFLFAFRLIMIGAAVPALAAAGFGFAIRRVT